MREFRLHGIDHHHQLFRLFIGDPGGSSYAVFISSILILVFSLLAIYFFCARRRQMISSRADKIFFIPLLGVSRHHHHLPGRVGFNRVTDVDLMAKTAESC